MTRNILRNQEEHRCALLLRPFATQFHLLQELYNFLSCFFCQVQGNVRVGSVASHSFSLYNPDGLSSTYCTLSSHCQCFAHSFLFAPPRHSVGFVILWRSPAAALCALDHRLHLSLNHLLHFSFSSFDSCCGHFPLCSTISPLVSFVRSSGILGWKPSHPSPVFALYIREAFSKSPSFSLGSASSYLLNSSFFQGLSCAFCASSSHRQCVDHSSCLVTV